MIDDDVFINSLGNWDIVVLTETRFLPADLHVTGFKSLNSAHCLNTGDKVTLFTGGVAILFKTSISHTFKKYHFIGPSMICAQFDRSLLGCKNDLFIVCV